ncbi:MAG: DNA gyrase subunit A [Actinobacteria bacterium]|nr:DNA gyrase subunit A [Actinomycetota bacterium]MCL5887964.1 DNA gyrase subunit A [Actinomycetota bacterium]
MSEELFESTVLPVDIQQELRESFLEYSMSVIVARALPDVRDGLKPVHRRILHAMNESGLTPGRAYKKSAWTVGEVIGKYHPHGDAAVYDTMVRLAQDFSMREPLIDGHGNFGSVDGDRAAAMRYTEARLRKIASELLRDLDKETVDFGPNYDESLQEPLVLPARFPNLIVNGVAGIAVGMATNIPPHNLGEAIDAVLLMIDNPDASAADIMQVMPGPDFPTGGSIMGREGIADYYATGRGSIRVRGKAHIEQTSTGRMRIIITEIPYTVNKSKLVTKIAELVREKKLTEISDLRDESDRKGMRIVVELKNSCIPQVVLNKLFKHTQLQTGVGIIMLALVNRVPKTLTMPEMLKHYIEHQKEVVVRRTTFDLRKAEERAHILDGYVIALDHIDEVIRIIRGSADDHQAKASLVERFGFSDAQVDAILEMRLRRLTGLERGKIDEELNGLRERIAWYKQVLGDVNLVLQIIKDELTEIREKFANPRRTELAGTVADLDVEDLIAEEDMVVTITRAGYVKRLPVATYRQQKRGGKGVSGLNLKESDLVEHLFISSTHDYVLFFSTKGKVYRLKVHELPVGSRHARGTAAVNLLPFEQGEKIAAAITTREFGPDDYLLFATRAGMVKKTALQAYDRSRRDGLIAINLRSGDELIAVKRVKSGEHVVMVSSAGKAIVWNESDARPMGRDTMGVKGMNIKEGEAALGMEIAPSNSELFVVTERGFGKRTPVDAYPVQRRGGQGVRTIQVTEKKGLLAGMKIIQPQHELMLISLEGVVIRVKADDISKLGRSTQGVKVMNVGPTDKVVAIARVSAGKKANKSKGMVEGQTAMQIETAEDQGAPGTVQEDRRLADAEDLVSEEFDDGDEGGE